MTERTDRDVEDWLEAESGDEADRADALFGAMLSRRMPRLHPAAGLPDCVLAALPRALPAAVPLTVRRWRRAAVFALLTSGGLAGATLVSTPMFELISGAALFLSRVLPAALAVAGAWWSTAWQAWSITVSLGRAAALVATSGPAIALVAGNLTLALVASIGLKRLLSPQEESS